MEKFNTHGGYFAPQGYMKVNEGGSHDENPNGGVQVGMDQNGVPSLLEEGEPVYRDFVYSDNIKADKEFLKQMNIPDKYAGKLYSEIADSFLSEAEERPNDPVSTNGLNAMLGRLADAQETQKQAEEEAALMEELKNMSPEELAQLEAMLAAEEQGQQMPAGEVIAPKEIAPEQPVQTFDGGGRAGKMKPFGYYTRLVGTLLSPVEQKEITLPDGSKTTMQFTTVPGVGKVPSVGQMNRAFGSGKNVWPWIATSLGLTAGGMGLKWATENFGNPDVEDADADYEYNPNDFARGGNLYAGGGWEKFLKLLGEYQTSRNPGGTKGTYKIDSAFPLAGFNTIKELEDSDAYKRFTDYVLANPDNENVQNYLRALDAGTNANVAKLFSGNKLADNWKDLYKKRRYDQKGGIYHFSTDDLNNLPGLRDTSATLRPIVTPLSIEWDLNHNPALAVAPAAGLEGKRPNLRGKRGVSVDDVSAPKEGFDWRLMDPILATGQGLATAFMEPDHYEFNPIKPYLPYGYLRQQYERYNPIDVNLITNRMEAQNQANARALRTAGIGPALGATLLANDYNAQQNLGNALTNVWDANNQRRNQVIAQNNQADANLANFYWNVEQADANALNQFAPYNQRMAMQTEMLNNQAEQDKFNALSDYINGMRQFFSGYGTEGLNRSMVNSNPAFLGYGINRNNRIVYDRNGNPLLLAACGGSLKK